MVRAMQFPLNSCSDNFEFIFSQGGFILDMGVHFVAGLRMVIDYDFLDGIFRGFLLGNCLPEPYIYSLYHVGYIL